MQTGTLPLGIAAGKGHAQIVKRLLDAGAHVNYQTKVILMPDY